MQYKANSPEEYISQLPEDRQEVVSKLLKLMNDNLPKGFQEQMNYGMPGIIATLNFHYPSLISPRKRIL